MNFKRGFSGSKKLQISGNVSLLVFGILSVIIFLTASIYTLAFLGSGTQPIFKTETIQFSEGWVDNDRNSVTLPAKLKFPSDGYYDLRTIVPEMGLEEQDLSLLFSAKYLNVNLFLDNKEIGNCLGRTEDNKKLLGKNFIILKLPNDVAGKELRIEAVPLLDEDMEYEINAPIIGAGEHLIFDLINGDIFMLVTLEAIFCFGLLLMLFSWQARRTGNTTFFLIGLFAIFFALYSFAITDTIHLFFSNSQFIYLVEFLLLALAPLPLLALAYNVCLPKYRAILLITISLLTLNFCGQTGLYFFTELEMRDMVQITHIILALSVIVLIPILALSGRKGNEGFLLLISFSPVLIGGSWDLIRFYLPGMYQKAVGFQLGVLLFIFLQTVYLVRSYLESDLYREVAYTDVLTGLENRNAFEERIVQLGKNSSHYASIWCVCADVNSLKIVNDTLGHSAGDELICGAAKVLRETKSKDSNLYRTGGDEFVIFAFNQSEESMKQGDLRFEAALKRYNKTHDVNLSIAIGYSQFCKGDTINKLISRSDSIMYKDKHQKKMQITLQ